MAGPTLLLTHAITPLAFDRAKLHRERLVDMIHGFLPRKLIVMVAPPGYGKSTLLADFAAHTQLPVCWVRLSEADRDVMRLAGVLQASLQKRFRRLRGQPDLAALSDASPEALARAFAGVIEAQLPEPFVVAMDDIQLVNPSRPVMAFLDALLQEQPGHMTILAAGRDLPDLSLAKLVVDGDMTGISQHDLALTREELADLSRLRRGAEIAGQEAERLLQETQGWISGVLLSASMLGSASSALARSGRPMVYEYLAAVVLAHQPDDLYGFMLESSVLPVMTAEACDTVLECQDSQKFLTRLVREGLFVVATDQTPRTYEFHPLLRQFLLETLGSKDAARLRGLRERAADYLAAKDSAEEAVALYFQAGAVRRAAALAEKRAPAMHEMGRIQTLETWAQRLGESEAASPSLLLYLATGHADRGDLEAAEQFLQQALGLLENGRGKRTELARAHQVEAWIAVSRGRYEDALRAVGQAERLISPRGSPLRRATCLRLRERALFGIGRDLEQAEKLALEAVRLLERTDDRYTLSAALVDLSLIQHVLGKTLDVEATRARAHRLLESIGAPLPLAISYNNLAVGAHLEGRYDHALQLFAEGLKYAHRAASPRYEASILYGQADLFSDLGLPFQAAALYDQGLRLAARLENVDLLRYGYMQTSALHRRCGTATLPFEWLERARSLDKVSERPLAVDVQLAALSIGASPANAERRLLELLRGSQGRNRAAERTLLLYFLTKAALAAGNRGKAQDHWAEALRWAGGHGLEQVLAGELTYDEEIREFARQWLAVQPFPASVLERVESMRAVARSYREKAEVSAEAVLLRLSALGASEIRYQGERVPDLEPLPRQLLFFLIDRKQAERDQLLEAFWPEVPVGRQVSSLYTAMHSLRRVLDRDVIRIDGSVYGINPECEVRYDVDEFERAADLALGMPPGDPRRFFALTEAVNIYVGIYLPEFSSEWVLVRRRMLEGRFLQLLTLHAEEALVRGQPLQAVSSFRQALQIDPLRDDINLHYLELLGLLNRRSEAVGHYQKYVRLLAEELGLDPPEAVRQAYARLIG
jgi:ATP/maltotriose-dependent transcriptional regulator MalT/DNA-binding SARP family transcriptional activator